MNLLKMKQKQVSFNKLKKFENQRLTCFMEDCTIIIMKEYKHNSVFTNLLVMWKNKSTKTSNRNRQIYKQDIRWTLVFLHEKRT